MARWSQVRRSDRLFWVALSTVWADWRVHENGGPRRIRTFHQLIRVSDVIHLATDRHRSGDTLAHLRLGCLTQGSATTQRAAARHLQHYTSKVLRGFYEMTRSNGAVPRHATVAFRPDFLKLTIGRLTDVCGATVENLHSPSKSTKGAESLGPFGFAVLRGCGAGFEPATFGL